MDCLVRGTRPGRISRRLLRFHSSNAPHTRLQSRGLPSRLAQSMAGISGSAAEALSSLTAPQLGFIRSLPKAELHAHLNGSIPIQTLQLLANQLETQSSPAESGNDDLVQRGLEVFRKGVEINQIDDFFTLFPAIYTLTSTTPALKVATNAVLEAFLGGSHPECTYIELRTTPRATLFMTRREYLEAVLDEIEGYSADQAALIVSVDRRMSVEDASECVKIAIDLKQGGRRVVGVDLCGDPLKGEMDALRPVLEKVRQNGLGLTLHIAETAKNTSVDTNTLLSANPSRLGHATFLDPAEQQTVLERRLPVEICLSSNLICKTVPTLEDHHIGYYLQHQHPIAICTDDILPFRTSLTAEYALLMATPPLGLGLSEAEISRIAQSGLESRFVG